jgi:hypothetical protein
VDRNAEILAEGNLLDFNQIELHVFAPLLGETVILLRPLYTLHGIKHGQTLGFSA